MDISHFDYCQDSLDSVVESYKEMEEQHIGKMQ
jgi:hypothetical protein